MKVLMLGWELPPHNSGGLGVACWGLSKALAEKGVKVTFVLPKKIDVGSDFMEIVFANVKDVDHTALGVYKNYSHWKEEMELEVDTPHDFVRGAFDYAEKIQAIAKKHNADIVHAHDWLTYPAGVSARKTIGKPYVAHIHSTEYDRTGGNSPNPVVYKIESNGLRSADKVISVSDFTKNIVVDKYGVDHNKVHTVHNGAERFDSDQLPPALEEMKKLGYKMVLFLGRITLQKGPDYFVHAAKIVSDFEDKVMFVVTGSGDMQEQMIGEAARLGISDKFIFTGFIRGQEKDRIFQSADVYVMPSVSEPFGITALESVVNGTPALISKQSGVSEVLHHVLKADFWDVEEMANKIVTLLRYDALKNDLSKESIKEVRNVNWHNSADKCINIYNHLI